MFKTLQNALKMKELRGRLIFTFLMLLVIRFGSQLPVPGVDPDYFADFFNGSNGDAFNLFNAMTGGSFENFSILALSISPYITSSIINSAADNCNSKAGRAAAGWSGRKKKDRRDYQICYSRSCSDSVYCYVYRIWQKRNV